MRVCVVVREWSAHQTIGRWASSPGNALFQLLFCSLMACKHTLNSCLASVCIFPSVPEMFWLPAHFC